LLSCGRKIKRQKRSKPEPGRHRIRGDYGREVEQKEIGRRTADKPEKGHQGTSFIKKTQHQRGSKRLKCEKRGSKKKEKEA